MSKKNQKVGSKKKDIEVNLKEKRIVKASDIRKEKRAKKISNTINFLMLVLVPFALIFFGVLFQKETVGDSISWIFNNFGIVILNYVFIYTIYFMIQTLSKRPTLSFILTSLLYLIFPIISKIKFDVRGEVLLTNDLALAGNVGELTGFVEISPALKTHIIFGIIFIIIVTAIIFIKKIKINRKSSGINFLLFGAAFLIAFVIPATSKLVLSKAGVNLGVRFAPNTVHEKEGTWLGLYTNYIMNNMSEPDGYSKERVYAILDNAKNKANKIDEEILIDSFGDVITSTKSSNKVSKEKPNVIIVMSESFFDPLVVPNVEYSQDPIPNFRKYWNDYESGKMISATFGGGTSTVEFEVFTGETVEFMPYGTVPYTDLSQNIQNIDSIQKIFKENGYKTIALHDYDGTFYNRKTVYPVIGFDEFYESKEMIDVNYFGKYISDKTMNTNIIDQLEKQKDEDVPLFIWALTMQNHTPYQTSNFTEGFDRVKIKSDVLSDEAKDKLLAYVNGVYESDIQLKNLIDYLDKSKEPTVLLFYGDHLPSLYEVYYDSGMIDTKVTSDWNKDEMLKMHTIPYFIYDNYSQKEPKHDNITGAVLLGNKLLNYVGIKKSPYFNFLDTLNYFALRDRLFIDENGQVFDSITKECETKSKEHKLLEYDMMYGNNYIKDYMNEKK
ncbi:MAG: LTA synthase family protein [Clostridia bacterium]|nr:LTA synthase family protein [Clostridia bacterium]